MPISSAEAAGTMTRVLLALIRRQIDPEPLAVVGLVLDVLDDAEALIGVDDPVSDLERVHEKPYYSRFYPAESNARRFFPGSK